MSRPTDVGANAPKPGARAWYRSPSGRKRDALTKRQMSHEDAAAGYEVPAPYSFPSSSSAPSTAPSTARPEPFPDLPEVELEALPIPSAPVANDNGPAVEAFVDESPRSSSSSSAPSSSAAPAVKLDPRLAEIATTVFLNGGVLLGASLSKTTPMLARSEEVHSLAPAFAAVAEKYFPAVIQEQGEIAVLVMGLIAFSVPRVIAASAEIKAREEAEAASSSATPEAA
jgi:hypothetical protein